ncbi:MAG: hypothetical protein FWD98_08840, partial [Defluviitaleaceae bacterium]|nr:hypothetical protein [Defluviitaleaceae bacterium]
MRKFTSVFTPASFTAKTINAFSRTNVEKVLVNSSERTLNVRIHSPELIDEGHIHDLESELSGLFPKIGTAKVLVSYSLPVNRERGAFEVVDAAWGNLVAKVKRVSPLCAKILADAAPGRVSVQADGRGLLAISTPYDAAFLLKTHNIAELIESYFRTSFDTPLTVSFSVAGVKAKAAPKADADTLRTHTPRTHTPPETPTAPERAPRPKPTPHGGDK